ncbi:MAG: hypothetical protein IPN58_13115 [Anaerolineales bacterium]|nr:hypothetical protein [Anaerolineales bacterium]
MMEKPQQTSPFPQSQPINSTPPKANSEGPGVFYYIAGISLLNSVLVIFNIGFYGSLAITMLVSGIGLVVAESVNGGTMVSFMIHAAAFLVNAVIAGMVAGVGFLSGKGYAWAYVFGMVAYTVDALIMLWLGDWLEVLVHLYVLYLLWKGWTNLRKVNAVIAKAEETSPSVID